MNDQTQRISVVVAHRRELIRTGLYRLLERAKDIQVVGEGQHAR